MLFEIFCKLFAVAQNESLVSTIILLLFYLILEITKNHILPQWIRVDWLGADGRLAKGHKVQISVNKADKLFPHIIFWYV